MNLRAWASLASLTALLGGSACGAGEVHGTVTLGDAGADAGSAPADAGPADASAPSVVGLAIDPATATLTCRDGQPATLAFRVVATYGDGHTSEVAPSLHADPAAIGSFDARGVFTALGTRGGDVAVEAAYGGLSARATLTVAIALTSAGTVPNADPLFSGAAGSDPARQPVVLYPEDQTVYPIGVYAPEIQWQGGQGNDLYRVRVTDRFVTLTAYVTEPALRIDPAHWAILGASSTTEPARIEVDAVASADAAHTVFTSAATHLVLAKARLGGTVYYWDLDGGKIMRIRPGEATAGEFFTPPAEAGTNSTCVACHTLSRDGRQMAFQYYGGSGPGGVADVQTGAVVVPPGAYSANFSTFNPDGSLLVTSWADGHLTLRDARSGQPVPAGSGEGNVTAAGAYNAHPAWSADGGLLAFACQGTPADFRWDVEFGASGLCTLAWNQTSRGFVDGSLTTLVANDGLAHFYPTFSADSRFVVYNQGEGCPYGARSLGMHLSLWLVGSGGGAPVQLARAASSGQDFYPNFSPFIEDGYHFVAFYSRRNYGWRTSSPRRQIWVAAIDREPIPGVDPSHPAFWLPGQSVGSDNTSAYWAPEPCRQDAESCTTDLDCCAGFRCDTAGTKTCHAESAPCAQAGNLCSSDGDCCQGLSCLMNSAGERVCTQFHP